MHPQADCKIAKKNHELVQEMKETLSEKLEQIICDNLGNCTDDSEIELRNSSLNCLDSQTIGTHSAILSRPNAEMIQLLRNLSLNLENGTIQRFAYRNNVCHHFSGCGFSYHYHNY